MKEINQNVMYVSPNGLTLEFLFVFIFFEVFFFFFGRHHTGLRIILKQRYDGMQVGWQFFSMGLGSFSLLLKLREKEK